MFQKIFGKNILFKDLLYQWMYTHSIRLKGGTIKKYTNIIETHIIPELGNVSVNQLDAKVINAFLSQKSESGRIDGTGGLSPSYVRTMALIISSAMLYGTQEKICMPLKSPIIKPPISKKELSILDCNTQKKLEEYLLKEFTPTNIGIFISLYTGLRIGEICALSWEDIDLDKKIINVRHTVSRVKSEDCNDIFKTKLILDKPKTRFSERQIPVHSRLLEVIKEFKNISKSSYVVSNNNNFVSPRTFEARYHTVLKKSNIPSYNYHSIRHTFATRCIESGVDVKSLSEILGHSNVSITLNIYVHSSVEMKRNQLEKLTFFA